MTSLTTPALADPVPSTVTVPCHRLFYFDDEANAFVPVPFLAASPELLALLGFTDMADGDERVVRFRRVDVEEVA